MAMRYSEHVCWRFQYTMELLNKRWVAMILVMLMDRPLHFNELAAKLQVVADRMLSERLKELEAQGIVARIVHPSTPVRVEYALTEKGKAFKPILDALETWCHEWVPLDAMPESLTDQAVPLHADRDEE
jgi:DNA-binding HxlR family transcriptional regulator